VSKARLVITAVVVEGRRPAEVAAAYGVARSWVYELVARWRTEGDTAFEPRSRRPKTSPTAIPAATAKLIVELRQRLICEGLDAGAETIRWHLDTHHHIRVSRATIDRTLQRHGLVVAQPAKRPRSSYIRFQADQPNETWQADFTHYRLTNLVDVEILTWLDDHARYALSVTAHLRVTGTIVRDSFRDAVTRHGTPASTLTDNGMVFTTRLSGGKGGRNALETELRRLGIVQKNSRPNHPTTCGKVERFQQTMKRWLRQQPDQPRTITELQTLLDRFVDTYNRQRPHRSLTHGATPAVAYSLRPKAAPGDRSTDTHYRVRHDRVSQGGNITLRLNGRLHHIAIGRHHTGTRIIMLIADLDVRVINALTGEILRHLTLNPHRDYQPAEPPTHTHPKPRRFGASGMS
jgi:transposase InsO family protein